MTANIRFGILGPLEVEGPSGLLDLGRPKQRAVLAVLLINSNRTVSVDRLLEELWGVTPPAKARGSLQAYVSNLRRLLEPDRPPRKPATTLVSRPPGYALVVGAEELDAARFEELTTEGRRHLSDGRFRNAQVTLWAALELWRGPALADFTYEAFAQGEIARLHELRLAAVEDRMEADLACGDHGVIVAELERLVRENPLRERLRAQLMLALYRSGRQAEALAAYQGGRRLLDEELGIAPGSALKALEARILQQSPELDWVPPHALGRRAATVASPSTVTLIGRDREIATLDSALAYASGGQGRLVLISGEAGIGKTLLVEAFTASAALAGYAVVWGRCLDNERPSAFWPWIQALRALIVGRTPADLDAAGGFDRRRLAQLIPELGGDASAVDRFSEPEDERFELYGAVQSFLARFTAAEPLVVALDDLHWADASSLRLLQFLASELHSLPLLIVGTFRSTEVAADHPLAATLADLARRPATLRIHLEGFNHKEVGRYIELLSGQSVRNDIIGAVHRRTEGNPFFVAELARLFSSQPALDDLATLRTAEDAIPTGVRDVIRQRLARLSVEARGALTVAAVIGRDFTLDILQRASDLPADELLDALDVSVAGRLLVADRTSPGRYGFAHALVREAIHKDVPELRRARIHANVASAIEELRAAQLEPHLPDLAYHYGGAMAVGYAEKAVQSATAAAEYFGAQLAYDEAAAAYEAAMDALAVARPGDEETRYELLFEAGTARRRAGNIVGCRAAMGEAVRLAERMGDRRRHGRAAAAFGGFTVLAGLPYGLLDAEAVELMQGALEVLGDDYSALASQIKGNLAIELFYGPDPQRRDRLSAEAAEVARRLRDPHALARALYCRYIARWDPDGLGIRRDVADEMLTLPLDAVPREVELLAHFFRLVVALESADIGVADADLEVVMRLSDRLRLPLLRNVVLLHRSMRCTLEGRLDEADELRSQADVVQEESGFWEYRGLLLAQTVAVRREQGRLAELEPALRGPDLQRTPGINEALALACLERGDRAAARGVMDRSPEAADLPRDHLWIALASYQSEIFVCLGELEKASRLYALLRPYSGRVALAGGAIVCLGAVDHFLGELARVLGHAEEAGEYYASASATNDRIRGYPWAARSRLALARLLLDGRTMHRGERARSLIDEAEAIGRRLRLPPILEQARALVDRAGSPSAGKPRGHGQATDNR